MKINGKTGYDTPGHAEYIAHKQIEPMLEDYIRNASGYKNGKQPKLKYRHGKLPRHEDGLVPGLGKPKKLTPRDIKVSPGEPGL